MATPLQQIKRLHLAYFSPLPPARSGISDYSRELLPHLAQLADLTLYVDNPATVATALQTQFEIRAIAQYPAERWRYDLPLYQMGNNDQHHGRMYDLLLRYPGLVVLHDYFLHGFIIDRTKASRLYRPSYDRELGYAWGAEGMNISGLHWVGVEVETMSQRPLNERLLDSSLAIIVHSQYAHALLKGQRPFLPAKTIPQLVQPPTAQTHRAKLDWAEDTVIFASLGQIMPAKQIKQALNAFKIVHQSHPHVRYLLVGENNLGDELDTHIQHLGLTNVVHQVGHVDDLKDFVAWIQTPDVILNLRNPTVGETSATALRGMGAGKPIIVYDHGWYSEIPDEACAKVPPDDKTALVTAMSHLAQSKEAREKMGNAGKKYTTQTCHPAHIAQQYISFITQLLAKYTP